MRLLLLALLLTVSEVVISQECQMTFKGTIIDFHDNSPLSDALIYLKSENRSFISDSKGNFEIRNLCSGEIELVVSHISCEDKTIKFKINGNLKEIIFMEHHVEDLSQITIKGSGTKALTKTSQENTLKQAQLFKYSASSLGDALREVNGVTSINTGSTIAKPMINGLHSNRVLIVNNGVRMQDQEWGIEHAPNVDLTSASQISVIKGSGALAYGGDAIGGVIVINPRRVISGDTIYGQTTIGGQSNGWGANINTSLNKSFNGGWFVNLQGSYRGHGDLEAPDYNLSNTGEKSGGFTINTGLNKFEYGFSLFYSFLDSEIAILRASHTGSVSDLVRAINSDVPLVIEPFTYAITPPKQEVNHQIFKATFYKRFQNFGKLSANYDYQNNERLEFDVRRGDRADLPAVDLELQTHTLNLDTDYDAADNYKLKFGLLGRYQVNFPDPATGVRRLIPDYDRYDFGAYITSEFEFENGHILEAGIRYDFNYIDALKFYRTSRWQERGYDEDFSDIIIEDLGTQLLTNPKFDYHNFSFSIGSRIVLNQNLDLLINLSRAMRAPNPAELFSDGLHHSAARFELGDLRIEQETSHRFASSLIYSSNKFSFEADIFVNYIEDFIYIEPTGQETTNRGPFPIWEYKSDNSVLLGFDLSFSYNFTKKWLFSNQTSYVRGQNKELDLPLINMPPFQTKSIIRYSIPDWNEFGIGLEHNFVAEQKRFPDNNFEAFIPTLGESVEVDISTPPPAYNLFNLNADWSFKLNSKSNLTAGLIINNVFDTSYRNYLNQLRFFADEIGRNFIIQLKLNY